MCCCLHLLQLLYFLNFFPRVNFSACQNAGKIRGWEQKEGGVNINWQHMQSWELACMCSATTQGPCCCQQWTWLSQLLGISCHPSRLCTVPRATVWVMYTKLLHLEPHPPCVNFIFVGALFKGLTLFSRAHTRSEGSIQGRVYQCQKFAEKWAHFVLRLY